LPGKNIMPLAGKPLIAHSILAAKNCRLIDEVMVSTDSSRIAAVAAEWGAEVPSLRPAHLAQDMSTDLEVFRYVLERFEKERGFLPDAVVQLRPTTPIRPDGFVTKGIELLLAHPEADSVRSVTLAPVTPYKMWRLPEEGNPSPYLIPLLELDNVPEPYNEPRQRLPPVYWHTGTLDVIRPRVILELNSMSGRKILPLYLPPHFAVDIDHLEDLRQAERVLSSSE
jgi:CMP-N,N'-diacetyllegionaminic acid synthase